MADKDQSSTAAGTAVAPAPDPKDLDKLTEAPQMAAKEPVGQTEADVEHLNQLREDALMQMTRQAAKSIKFNERLERRHAVKEPVETARRLDVEKSEAERLVLQEKAAAEAAERAAKWIAPDKVKGRTDEVTLVLNPPEEQRKMTIHLRALGEVDDGYIMVFEDPADPADPKLGRIAESERFGTKNRVRVEEIDSKTGKTSGEVTYLGYKDFGPLRMNPGDYVAVVVDMDDGVLAKESFSIVPDWDQDNKSDQVYGVRAPKHSTTEPKAEKTPQSEAIAKAVKRGEEPAVSTSNEAERAAMQETQVARDKAKSAGIDVPPAPASDAKPELTKEQKAAAKDTPEARAQKG